MSFNMYNLCMCSSSSRLVLTNITALVKYSMMLAFICSKTTHQHALCRCTANCVWHLCHCLVTGLLCDAAWAAAPTRVSCSSCALQRGYAHPKEAFSSTIYAGQRLSCTRTSGHCTLRCTQRHLELAVSFRYCEQQHSTA